MEKDIHQNDWVRLQRSGEVIPYIVGVIKDRREETDLPCIPSSKEGPKQKKPPLGGEGDHEVVERSLILPPTHCPSCNQEVSQEDMHYFCRNPECPAQLEQRVIWFVSKNAMNIE